MLAAEIGGVCIALQLVTGISFQWWALPVAFAIWVLLWYGNGIIENGVALLGLITLVFVVATFKLHPSLTQIGSGLLPTLPQQDTAHYLFIAVSILGALISPYLFYFYSSGAVEDHWDEGHRDRPLTTDPLLNGAHCGDPAACNCAFPSCNE